MKVIIMLIMLLCVLGFQPSHAQSEKLLAYSVSYEQAPPVEKRIRKNKIKKHKKFKYKTLKKKNKPNTNQERTSKRFYTLAIIFGSIFLIALISFIVLFVTGGSIGLLLLLIIGAIGIVGLISFHLAIIFLIVAGVLRKKGK